MLILEISLFELFTLCAVINGLIFAILILEKQENQPANRFLALMIVCLCLTFTPYMLDTAIWHQYRWLAWLPFSLSYWIGPAFYFYVLALTHNKASYMGKDLWHFSPILLNYLHSVYHGLVGPTNPFPGFHHIAELLESAAILSILTYLMLSFRVIKTYQASLLDQVSYLEKIDLSWIIQVIVTVGLSFLGILIFLAISSGLIGKETLYQWDTMRATALVFYSSFLYWVSINGYRQAQIAYFPDLSSLPGENTPSELPGKIKLIIERHKLYRNPTLGLADLSKIMDVSEKSISQAINHDLGKNFYQLINEYRVAEVKERLVDPGYAHLKILSLGLDAGFNSKASFHRVFKSITGTTPVEYKTKNTSGFSSFETSSL